MVDRSERQVTHPWLMARQRAAPDLPGGAPPPSRSSDARRELEAAFHPSPAPACAPTDSTSPDGGHGPEVVVKRRRTVVAATLSPSGLEGPSDSARDADFDPDRDRAAEMRAPRVFRVEALAHMEDEPGTSGGHPDALTNDDRGVEAHVEPLPAVPTRRPRRRAAPAVVTFVATPQAQEVAGDTRSMAAAEDESPGVYAPGDSRLAVAALATDRRLDALLQRLRRLDATLSQIREARGFRVMAVSESKQVRQHGNRYRALRISVEKLKQQAEIARRSEAASAIQWIKRQIARYGLTREDVGL
jgi:hypothetical protein